MSGAWAWGSVLVNLLHSFKGAAVFVGATVSPGNIAMDRGRYSIRVSPRIQESVSPSVRQSVSPSVREFVSLSLRESMSPSVRQSVSPSVHQSVSP